MKYKVKVDLFKGFKFGDILFPFNNGVQYGLKDAIAGDYCIPDDVIKSLPEYFEEVKEKEYTILSFISTDESKTINRLQSDGGYGEKFSDFSLDEMLKGRISVEDGSFKIHSVRRESDGETFQLEDKLDLPFEFIIGKITIDKNTLVFENKVDNGYTSCPLNGHYAAQKAPIRKPILVTEDGKEIFEGDSVYIVTEDFELCARYVIKRNVTIPSVKYFSDIQSAKEYIKWNKPMYSLNDINKANNKSLMENKDLIKVIQELDRK